MLIRESKTRQTQAEPKPLAGKKVLIADDMDYNRAIGREIFRLLGADFDEASDGHSALEKLKASSFHIALIDISMPGLNGLEVARSYRDSNPQTSCILVALSAHTMDQIESKCMAAGFSHFIPKPLSKVKILEALQLPGDNGSEKATSPNSTLLDYLADENPAARQKLHERHLGHLNSELSNLRQAITTKQPEPIREALHRLTGLLHIELNPKILKLLDTITRDNRSPIDERKLQRYCDAIELIIREELD